MTTITRFLQVFALGTWVGGIIFLSFVVAPGAFAALGSRDQAAALVGLVLAGLVRWAKRAVGGSAHLAGVCSVGKFVVPRAAGPYDARDRGPNRKIVLIPGTV